MKTGLVILALSMALLGYSQPGKSIFGSEEYPANVDSIVYYNYRISDSSFAYAYTNSYLYDEDRIIEVFSKSSVTGTPISRANYEFNADGYRVEYINYLWQNGEFANSFKQTYTYNSKNLLEEFISYTWTNGEWKFNNRYVHFYTNDLLTSIDIYSLDANGMVVLKNQRFYEYDGDLIKRFYTTRVSDGVIMSTANYTYDSKGKVISRIDEALTYDRVLKKYFLLPSSRNTYSYDGYSLLREIFTESWVSGNWQSKQKMVYHYRIDSAKRVAICHNNRTIIVSKNSLPAHFRHGDVLGKCVNPKLTGNGNDPKDKVTVSTISAYPNPALEYVTISGVGKGVLRVDLISQSGNVVRSIKSTGSEFITINRDGLPQGFYFIKVIYSNNSVKTLKVLFQ